MPQVYGIGPHGSFIESRGMCDETRLRALLAFKFCCIFPYRLGSSREVPIQWKLFEIPFADVVVTAVFLAPDFVQEELGMRGKPTMHAMLL